MTLTQLQGLTDIGILILQTGTWNSLATRMRTGGFGLQCAGTTYGGG